MGVSGEEKRRGGEQWLAHHEFLSFDLIIKKLNGLDLLIDDDSNVKNI